MHDELEAGDHGLEVSPNGHAETGPIAATGSPGFVPMADPVAAEPDPDFTPDPEGPSGLPGIPLPEGLQKPGTIPFPWPHFHLCKINLRAGCYRISFQPSSGIFQYFGTMRVDDAGGKTTISGDLYRFLRIQFPIDPVLATKIKPDFDPKLTVSPGVIGSILQPLAFGIPIYPRNRYYSYLRVTGVQTSPVLTTGPCQLTLTAQEYRYTQPPAGSFDGTFPAAPGTRTVTIVLHPAAAPAGFTSSYFEGTLYDGGVAQGAFTMGWVSKYYRRATLEIDTLVGAVAPQPVGGESFQTVYAKAGWDLNVVYDQTNVPVPAGVTATNCWASGDLHNLMQTVRNPATNLDAEWHMHLLVVPAKLGCGRGVMYDTIGVPREGVASFCDDGYPTSDSSWFGTAANQEQRNVPRAFLRSACHETGHGFNQIHQEQEGGADNSIMTTTPSVANVLEGPTTGAPGIFPDQINLAFNDHVRHHLVHFPDPAVRPGGMTFGSGHTSTVPEADRYWFGPDELELSLKATHSQVALGEPLELSWTLENTSGGDLPVPTDIGTEAQHATVTVTDPHGGSKLVPSFVIRTDHVTIGDLEPGKKQKATTRVFWSSKGFAFPTPGGYHATVRIVWTAGGTPFGVEATTDVFVEYPQTPADNDAAAALLHRDVGMYVALGGGADHLTEAVSRLARVSALGKGDAEGAKALRGYEDLMPSQKVLAAAARDAAPAPARRRTARKRRPAATPA